MTSNQILTASFLDILFENRNKEYGAYSIRKAYPKHLIKAIGLMLLLVVVLCLYVMSKPKKNNGAEVFSFYDTLVVDLEPYHEKEKPKVPQQQRTVEAQPATKPDFVPTIVEHEVENPVPDRTDTATYVPGATNSPGTLGDEQNFVQGTVDNKPAITNNTEPVKADEPLIYEIVEIMPVFPERYGSVFNYLQKRMRMPYELEISMRKTVKVKFVVNINGDVTDAVITQSAGAEFDTEVLRVISSMPKWKPGTKNGKPVAVYFTQAVTFRGPEE